jgi:serine/threonine protein kinase
LDYYDFYSNRASRIQNALTKPNQISKSFNREYQIFNCLGKGGFGQVFDGRRRSDNSPAVLKFLRKDYILNWGTLEGVCNSINKAIQKNKRHLSF